MIYEMMKYKKWIIGALVLLLIICGIVYKNTVYETEVAIADEETSVQQETASATNEVNQPEPATITVYVCGSVKRPANVTLPKDARVEDAIKLAGGATESADLNAINLAQKLSDAEKVYVPKKGEIIEANGNSGGGSGRASANGKININKATEAELDALPGIGPSTAKKIIAYRNSKGGFRSIEELNNVSGIGDAKYGEVKDMITVD